MTNKFLVPFPNGKLHWGLAAPWNYTYFGPREDRGERTGNSRSGPREGKAWFSGGGEKVR